MNKTVLLLSLLFSVSGAFAQSTTTYPTKPVRIIVGFPPGGGVDTIARLISAPLSDKWGQQVIVDNRPGAGTIIGTTLAAKAQPDGYTILLASSSYGINPGLQGKNLPYDPVKDLTFISQVAVQPYVFALNRNIPVQTVNEFLTYARANPGKMNFGSPGNGSGGHLAVEYFKMMAKLNLIHVPYRGAAPALVDLIGGQIQMMFSTILPSLPHLKAGRLKAIAVSTAKRSVALPDVPTISEAGVAGYEASSWTGVMAPAGVPAAIVKKLQRDVADAVSSPSVREKILIDGAEPVGSNPEEFGRMVRAEIEKWNKVIKAANVKAE